MRLPATACTALTAALLTAAPAAAQRDTLEPLPQLRQDMGGAGGAQRGAEFWTVSAGQSFWRVAEDQLGPGATTAEVATEMTRIWNLNAGRVRSGDPGLIYPGERLRLN